MKVNISVADNHSPEFYGLLLKNYDLTRVHIPDGVRMVINIPDLETLAKFQAELIGINGEKDGRLVIYPCKEDFADYEFIIYDYYLE